MHVWANMLCVRSGREKDIQIPDLELASTWMKPFSPGDGLKAFSADKETRHRYVTAKS